MQITILQNQSLFDVALQITGDVSGVFLLAVENSLSITDNLYPGQILQYTGTVINKQIREYYQVKKINPATDCVNTQGEGIRIFADQFSVEFS